jgi:hypothetical protein
LDTIFYDGLTGHSKHRRHSLDNPLTTPLVDWPIFILFFVVESANLYATAPNKINFQEYQN